MLNVCYSDAAVKQILLSLNESNKEERFIVEDLDETHVMIAPEKVDRVRAILEAEVSSPDILNATACKQDHLYASIYISWRRTRSAWMQLWDDGAYIPVSTRFYALLDDPKSSVTFACTSVDERPSTSTCFSTPYSGYVRPASV